MSSTPKPGEAVKYPPPVVPTGISTPKDEMRRQAPPPITDRAVQDLLRRNKR